MLYENMVKMNGDAQSIDASFFLSQSELYPAG